MPLIPKQQAPYYTLQTPLSIILTNDQIKALPTTPIEIIPSPGINKAIAAPVARGLGQAILLLNWNADYTNISTDATIDFLLGTNFGYTRYGQTNTLQNFLAWGAANPAWYLASTDYAASGSPYESLSSWTNSGLYIGATNALGNFTGGNPANTLKITLSFNIVNFN